jgi:solute carrier family 10 (sodium/bile acid cotransporter), member 7
MKVRIDWFVAALVGTVLLAVVFPEFGARGGVLYPELTNKVGVALIFFLHGVGLSFASLKAGVYHWRLHLVVQTCTFVIFPLFGLALCLALRAAFGEDLAFGLFFLAALPSTVSSSVALTGAAGGNVAGALFNATLSSLLGVILTPLWVSALGGAQAVGMDTSAMIADLCRWLVLPLVLGQAARPALGRWMTGQKKRLQLLDRWTILFLVYTSMCDSVLAGVWQSHGLGSILIVVAASALMFFGVLAIAAQWARRLRFSDADRIAAMFCGSKKSMATGVPMAQVMFGGSPTLAVVVMPLLVYHTLQLIIAGALASRWAQRTGVDRHA